MDQEDASLPPHRWPVIWLRDYTFWRDVTSTLIGGTLVLVLAFLWALFMGYLTSPGLWEAIGSFFAAAGSSIAILGTTMAALAAWMAVVARPETKGERVKLEDLLQNRTQRVDTDKDQS